MEASRVTQRYHQSRFTPDSRRDLLWQTLWRAFFCHRVPKNGCVLDVGCGYGQFINNVVAHRRIAIDSWPGFASHLVPGVEAITGDVTDLSMIEDSAVDFAFASNLFEHLTQSQLASALLELSKKQIAARTSHVSSQIVFTPRKRANEFQWDFIDERGRKWIGSELVEPSMEEQAKFVLTVRLNRAR